MVTDRDLDAFIDYKLGDRKGARSCELSLCSDEEYFMFVKATIRMTDEDETSCPFCMHLNSNPTEVRCGRYRIPNGYILRK